MRHQPAIDNKLAPTARPGAAKKLIKIVISLVALASAIAGAAWLTGQLRYEKDATSVATGEPQGAAAAPARPAR